MYSSLKTRITTFIKTKVKISEDQTNIEVQISCKYYSISYYIKFNLATNHCHKLLWSSEVKYNIGFWIPIKFPSQRRKIYSNQSRNNEIGLFLWSWQSFWESTILDFESPSNFQVKEKKLFKSVQNKRNYALIKNAKIVIFQMDVRTFRYWL